MAKTQEKNPQVKQQKDPKNKKEKEPKEPKEPKQPKEKDGNVLVGRVKKVVKKSRRKLGEEKFEKQLQRTIAFLEELQRRLKEAAVAEVEKAAAPSKNAVKKVESKKSGGNDKIGKVRKKLKAKTKTKTKTKSKSAAKPQTKQIAADE